MAEDIEYVELELIRRGTEGGTSEVKLKKVYVTEVNGTITLDLYSGWALEGEEHKFKLQHLPLKVCSFISLEKLWISHNNLSELPGQIDQLVNLRELFLHHNAFTEIPVRLFQLSKIEILWLSSNFISEIHPDITQMKSLRHLHLEHNQIEEFQESLCELPNLEVLYLNHNNIKAISHSVNKLANIIQRLYLHNNKIQFVPETLCELEKLEILYLNNNEIAYVPRNFETYCQKIKTSNKATVQVDHNPYVVPRAKVKLSVGGAAPSIQGLQLKSSRRHSDIGGTPRDAPQSDGGVRSNRHSVPSSGITKEGLENMKSKSATLKR